jgi:hypothetical protein
LADRYITRMLAVLHVTLWISAVRHAAGLCKLGLSNGSVLSQFAHEDRWPRSGSLWLVVWLPLCRYSRLFRPTLLLPAPKNPETERLRQLCRTLNKDCVGLTPAFDPLRSRRARRLQAKLIERVFRQLFGIQLDSCEALAVAGYGSAGLAARDFLNYWAYCGCSTAPLEVLFRLFIHESEIRHTRIAGRLGVVRLLQVNTELGHDAGLWHRARAMRYAAQRLLFRIYWSAEDRNERALRLSASRRAHWAESAKIAVPLRETALSTQHNFFILLAYEMHWQAVEELVQLHAQKARLQRNAQRFEASCKALEGNLESAVADYFAKEDQHARKVA